jgi:23S rRNA (uracil-5-)-methyltransferase RumA
VADVARGTVERVWGRDFVEERLGDATFLLSATSFFQTSAEGARVLYDAVGEALSPARGVLLDLYCGTGAIGLYLARRFQRVVGVEEVEAAVRDAEKNAQRNGIASASFRLARVEDIVDNLHAEGLTEAAIVVDPPRAGLHPRVTAALAAARAEVLVYVACNPASLGRDARLLVQAGWQLTDLTPVDLFPQTGHVEVIGRFRR